MTNTTLIFGLFVLLIFVSGQLVHVQNTLRSLGRCVLNDIEGRRSQP